MRLIVSIVVALFAVACSSVTRVPDQTYLSTPQNWDFRNRFRESDRLFNAFDYGHAKLYDVLVRHRGDSAVGEIEGKEFPYITTKLLVHPPTLPLEERAVGPTYSRFAPELLGVFDWAHMLHRQIYDVLADEKLDSAGRDARVRQLILYYQSRRDLALSTAPKSMNLMEGATYSLVFRREHPKFNGLLWSYHWYQLVIYDALLATHMPDGQRRNVDAATARFWELIATAPTHMPTTMPLAAGVSPLFAQRYPDAAIIFDNLHALHDVVADILASPVVTFAQKRATILRAMQSFQDSTTEVTSRDDWRAMALAMDVEKMGGTATFPSVQPE
ncbi:MAG TPA: hypothetical protein VGJ18_18695 [Gemmatimonadaceae bacterium]|jgi:hypothetical protein